MQTPLPEADQLDADPLPLDTDPPLNADPLPLDADPLPPVNRMTDASENITFPFGR